MSWKPGLAGPAKAPLWKRVAASVRAAVEKGDLRPGDRLPAAAAAAKALRLGKLTVVKAFRALEEEGLLAGHVGKGTFVRDGRPPEAEAGRPPAPADEASLRALRRVREGYAANLR